MRRIALVAGCATGALVVVAVGINYMPAAPRYTGAMSDHFDGEVEPARDLHQALGQAGIDRAKFAVLANGESLYVKPQ